MKRKLLERIILALALGGFVTAARAITPLIVIASSENPSGYQGDAVTFNATITANGSTAKDVTGILTFRVNGVLLGTGTINNGVATSIATTGFQRWVNKITAEFVGDVNYSGTTNSFQQITTNAPGDGFLAEDFTYTNVMGLTWAGTTRTNLIDGNTTGISKPTVATNQLGLGWSGSWIGIDAFQVCSNDWLTYSGGGYNIIQTVPNCAANFPELAYWAGGFRPVNTPLTNVVWFSTLMKNSVGYVDPTSNSGHSTNFVTLVSFNNNTVDTNSADSSLPNYFSHPPSGLSVGISNQFMFVGYGGEPSNSVPSGTAYPALYFTNIWYPTILATGAVHLVLGCVTFNYAGTNANIARMQVWADPTDLTHLGAPIWSGAYPTGTSLTNVTVGGSSPRMTGTGGRSGYAAGTPLTSPWAQISALRFSDGNGNFANGYKDVTGTSDLNPFQLGLTTLTLSTTSPGTNGYLDSITFNTQVQTNGVTASDAPGTVQFQTNGVNFGNPVPVSSGTASLTTTQLLRGTNIISALYSGDFVNYYYAGSSNYWTQVTTNHPPVATTLNVTRTAGLKLRIFWSNFVNNWADQDGDAIVLTNFMLTTANGVTLSTNSLQILYPASAGNENDQIQYEIMDSYGGTNTGLINIVVNPFTTGAASAAIAAGGDGSVSTTFHAVAGYQYVVQRSTDLSTWTDIGTTTAAANGTVSINDDFHDISGTKPSSAYYRLKWQP